MEQLEARIAKLERLVVYLCQVLGVEGAPSEQLDPEAQHRRFAGVLRRRV
jgi:hypothetical protein